MIDIGLLNRHCIVTPHQGEYERLQGTISGEVTILLKGLVDEVSFGDKRELIGGGNPGMTKGGTGDALAGLAAGLYSFCDDPFAVAVVASYVNKRAGDKLYESVGPFFTTNQLVEQIPKTLKEVLEY